MPTKKEYVLISSDEKSFGSSTAFTVHLFKPLKDVIKTDIVMVSAPGVADSSPYFLIQSSQLGTDISTAGNTVGFWRMLINNTTSYPPYDNAKIYTVGDCVVSLGSVYRMTTAVGAAGYAPQAYPGYWTLVSTSINNLSAVNTRVDTYFDSPRTLQDIDIALLRPDGSAATAAGVFLLVEVERLTSEKLNVFS